MENNPVFTIAREKMCSSLVWLLCVTGGAVRNNTRVVARLESEELAIEVRNYLFKIGFYHE